MMVVALKHVNGSMISWEVVARITRLWDSTNVKNNNEFMSIDMLLLDEEGTEVHSKIRKRQADLFRDKIKEGVVYKIRNFRVLENEAAFKPIEEKNTVIFLPTSTFKEVADHVGATIERNKFYFQKSKEIQERLNKTTYLTDVIGLIYGMSEIEQVDIRGDLVDKLDLKIDIERDYRLDVTLWAEKAKTFADLILSQPKGPCVVVVTSTIVKSVFGGIRLYSTCATKTYVNIDLPETREILTTFGARQPTYMLLKGKLSSALTLDQQMIQNRKTIIELTTMEAAKEMQNSVIVTLEARIMNVQNNFGWYYYSCENCKKKLQPKEKIYHCNSYKQDALFPNTSFKVELLVVDNTGETTLTMFEREVQQIIGISSTQLIGHYGASLRDIPSQLYNLLSRKLIFQLKVTDYNLIYGNQEYTVTKVFDMEKPGKNIRRGNDGIKVEETEFEDSASDVVEVKGSNKRSTLDSGKNIDEMPLSVFVATNDDPESHSIDKDASSVETYDLENQTCSSLEGTVDHTSMKSHLSAKRYKRKKLNVADDAED